MTPRYHLQIRSREADRKWGPWWTEQSFSALRRAQAAFEETKTYIQVSGANQFRLVRCEQVELDRHTQL